MPSKEITAEEYDSFFEWLRDKQGVLLMHYDRLRANYKSDMDKTSLISGWSVDDEPVILIHEVLD